MNDCIKNVLKKDMSLFRKYDRAEARYVLNLKNDYELVDLKLDLDEEEFSTFINSLAKENMCFDEWANLMLKKLIKQDRRPHEKTC